jgi:hypothetical protein
VPQFAEQLDLPDRRQRELHVGGGGGAGAGHHRTALEGERGRGAKLASYSLLLALHADLLERHHLARDLVPRLVDKPAPRMAIIILAPGRALAAYPNWQTYPYMPSPTLTSMSYSSTVREPQLLRRRRTVPRGRAENNWSIELNRCIPVWPLPPGGGGGGGAVSAGRGGQPWHEVPFKAGFREQEQIDGTYQEEAAAGGHWEAGAAGAPLYACGPWHERLPNQRPGGGREGGGRGLVDILCGAEGKPGGGPVGMMLGGGPVGTPDGGCGPGANGGVIGCILRRAP